MVLSNIKEVFSADVAVAEEADRGDLVQTVLITAGFAIAAILLISWISTAVINKGADVANCIEGANTFTASGADDCKTSVTDDGTKSHTADSNYTDRFN